MEIKLSNYNVGHELFPKIKKRKVTKDLPDSDVRCQCLNIWKGRNKVGEQKDVPTSREKIEDEGETGIFDVYNSNSIFYLFASPEEESGHLVDDILVDICLCSGKRQTPQVGK